MRGETRREETTGRAVRRGLETIWNLETVVTECGVLRVCLIFNDVKCNNKHDTGWAEGANYYATIRLGL